MVPYKHIRRWSVGEGRHLAVIRVIHRLHIALDASWTAIATPIILYLKRLFGAWCIAGLRNPTAKSLHGGRTGLQINDSLSGSRISEFWGLAS